MTYQPWQYAETKILHDLFQQKFGKVWETSLNIDYTVDEPVSHYVLTEDISDLYFDRGNWENPRFQIKEIADRLPFTLTKGSKVTVEQWQDIWDLCYNPKRINGFEYNNGFNRDEVNQTRYHKWENGVLHKNVEYTELDDAMTGLPFTIKNYLQPVFSGEQQVELPALTLSSFCEFVHKIQDKFIIPDSQKILMNIWLKSEIQEKIAKRLKHFAVDNWDEPQKIINEVKKYL
jgi:hypothetical protein